MKSVRLQLFESGLDVPSTHARLCGVGTVYSVASEDEKLTLADSRAYHRHFDTAAMALIQLTEFATAQTTEEIPRIPFAPPPSHNKFIGGRRMQDGD